MQELEGLDDAELIERIRGGADEARNVLFRRYHRKVAAWCLRICGDRETAATWTRRALERNPDSARALAMASSLGLAEAK